MQDLDKYKLSTYHVVRTLRSTENTLVEVVESLVDSERFIKVTYHSDKRQVFEILKNVRNQNLPRIIDVFFDEDTIVIEELVEGETLENMLSEKHVFRGDDILKITKGLINAVSALHDSGIIHRDIKPGNIIIKPSGEAVLIDFDIARIYSPVSSKDTEHYGTKGYAAPEQYGFSQSDFRSDIYALGVTLGEFKTSAGIPKVIDGLIERCTEFDPKRRFQNVGEINEYLDLSEKKRKTVRITLMGLFVTTVLLLLFILNNINSEHAHLETGNTPDSQNMALLTGVSLDERIVDTSGAGMEIPVIKLSQGNEQELTVSFGNSHDARIKASLKDETIELLINDRFSFLFKDSGELSKNSYQEGVSMAEIILYDINMDGNLEIIPVIANGIKADYPSGESMLLLNYSLGWCVYYDDGTYVTARECMKAEADPFKILDTMSGCIMADFPHYYRLEEGALIME
ncbi:MAG: serine/threonine-protein kinase [Eubacteriales bacterium]|nr:serine/threonine-protein kinase [Eubacteriales bacterium]